jgi:alkylation response protein AidB-like acyl-CoA dehydrogenase
MAAATDLWCQGWSEPEAGSDLASLRSRAVRDDEAGGWRLSGQKTWSTRGAFCTHLFGLFRTEPDSARHRGLTYFLVPLDAPGVTVRGFRRLDGDEGFADVWFEDALVPDSAVLGEVGQGWQVAMSTTNSERGLTLRSPGRYLATFQRLIELYGARELATAAPLIRDRLVSAWLDVQAYRQATAGQVERMLAGAERPSESSMTKVYWSELDIALHEIARDIIGAEAEIDDEWARGHLFALAGPIYAGTNEIQRNIIAERVLGLPR